MTVRPAFVSVPVAGGGSITATVANRDGIAEVDINGVPHIGLLLSVNAASATIAVLTPDEAARMSQQLGLAAVTVARRIHGSTAAPRQRDVRMLNVITRLHCEDKGADLFEVLDEAGQPVKNVVEVNADEGWIIQHLTDDDGAVLTDGDEKRAVKVRGTFTIHRRQPDAPTAD